MSKLEVFAHWRPLEKSNIIMSKDGKTYFIKGIASTEHVDQHDEIILQDGLDFSYALKSGHFNYDHKNDPKYILGAPQKISKVSHNGKKATEIEGILYADKQIVKDLMENISVMKNTNSGRNLGFSIEGQVLARDKRNPHIVTRAKVLNISLTHTPANPEGTVALVKNILANKETETMNKSDEYNDVPMSLDKSKLLAEYSSKMVQLLSMLPEDADLPEWCQAKIIKACDYMQAAYHYLDIEMKEGPLGKDVNPNYLESLEEESVVAPHSVEPPSQTRDDDYRTDANMDKAVKDDLMDYDRYKRFVDMLSKMYEKMYMKLEKDEDEEDESIEDMLEDIVEEYPELKDPEVMSMLHDMLSKMYHKMRDYKKMSDMSAIQPQSLEDDEEMASEDYSMKSIVSSLLKAGMNEKLVKNYILQFYKK